MASNGKLTSLLDRPYSHLSLRERNTYLIALLAEIIDCSALDGEAKDALDVFASYEWTAKQGEDQKVFNELTRLGESNNMDVSELDQFVDMVSETGQYHPYYLIRKARHAVWASNVINTLPTPDNNKIPQTEEQEYLVTWEIDETATSPLEAAIAARSRQINPDTSAVVFKVFDREGNETSVDLDEEQYPEEA